MPPSATEGRAEPPPPPPAPPPPSPSPSRGDGSKGVFRCALAAVAVWIAALIALAVWASNPVVLNYDQVLRARHEGVIVRARVADVRTGECEVIEQWPAAEPGGTIRVTNLNQTPAETGETYLLPLLRTADGYVVAPTKVPGEQPLIYPDTAEALAQLETILSET